MSGTVIVIRSLIQGGVAHSDKRIRPGDRLVYVNDTVLRNASLDVAVQALKVVHTNPTKSVHKVIRVCEVWPDFIRNPTISGYAKASSMATISVHGIRICEV